MTDVQDVKLSVATPVVTMTSGAAPWELHGSIDDLVRIAESADRLGYHHLTCSEHIAVPLAESAHRGTRYWDPLPTFGFLAAHTRQIRFATNVLVLGYHHPLEIAKRYGTLDKVSGGRLILGLGVGSLKQEFDLIGAKFDGRGSRAEDALKALRASLSNPEPSYHGSWYSYQGMAVDPCAVQQHVPIWLGGRTLRSLRRAAAHADGWCPFNVTSVQAQEWLQRVELPKGFEVVLPTSRRLDPINEPGHTQDVIAETAEHGATIIPGSFAHSCVQEYLDNLHALAELHIATT